MSVRSSAFVSQFGGYVQALQQRISSKWRIDETEARLKSLPCVVEFEILRDGRIQGIQVLESSGNQSADLAALRAVTEANPFSQLPQGYRGLVTRIEVGFDGQGKRLATRDLSRLATLNITGGTLGASVLLDGREVGKVNSEGAFQTVSVAPGAHDIELRMAGYQNSKTSQTFRAGETVQISNLTLARDLGTILLILSPSDTRVTYHQENETEHLETGGSINSLVPSRYVVTGRTPGYKDKQVPITVFAGQTATVDLTLIQDTPEIGVHTARSGTIRDFGPAWTADGDQFTHSGSPTAFGITPAIGTFRFKIQLLRGGGVLSKKIKWALGYTDGKNLTDSWPSNIAWRLAGCRPR